MPPSAPRAPAKTLRLADPINGIRGQGSLAGSLLPRCLWITCRQVGFRAVPQQGQCWLLWLLASFSFSVFLFINSVHTNLFVFLLFLSDYAVINFYFRTCSFNRPFCEYMYCFLRLTITFIFLDAHFREHSIKKRLG